MRCYHAIESCGSALFLDALTATFSTTPGVSFRGASPARSFENQCGPSMPSCLSLPMVQNLPALHEDISHHRRVNQGHLPVWALVEHSAGSRDWLPQILPVQKGPKTLLPNLR